MKVQLNRYTDAKGLETYGMPYDLSVPGKEEALADTTAHVTKGAGTGEIWFYTVENWTGDIWEGSPVEIINREFSVCYTCGRDISRVGADDPWHHIDGDVTQNHPVQPKKPKKPVVILDNDLEKLIMKYFHHLKAMGSDTFLEYHHHYNSPINFTDEEWAKLQELDIDAFIQE